MFIPPGIHFTDANGRLVSIENGYQGTYNVFADRLLKASLRKRDGNWEAYTQNPETTADDLQLLVEIMQQAEADGKLP